MASNEKKMSDPKYRVKLKKDFMKNDESEQMFMHNTYS